jgi:hypothetical protein
MLVLSEVEGCLPKVKAPEKKLSGAFC